MFFGLMVIFAQQLVKYLKRNSLNILKTRDEYGAIHMAQLKTEHLSCAIIVKSK